MITTNKKIFNDNQITLKEASKDNHDGVDIFMTQSSMVVIHFDGVKDDYVSRFNLPINPETNSTFKPKSNDVLFESDDGNLYFIEFKNGKINSAEKIKIRLKIADSLLIFNDIVKKNLNFTSKKMNYILVYNQRKHPSLDAVAKKLMFKANGKFAAFNMDRFEEIYFKEVFTYNEDEFEKNFVSKFSI